MTAETGTPGTGKTTLWGRVFAVLYDPFVAWGERAGLGALRADLLRRAAGRTVEVGGGTGLNLRHYPGDLAELILTEPDAAMLARLNRKLRDAPGRARALGASAEQLPFPDGSVDTVVTTLVLCTVETPDRALREIVRVLRPGGRLLFLEHVRSDSPRLARWQDRFERPWHGFAEGCYCNRATADAIRASGLVIEHLETGAWRRMPSIVRPLIVGVAVKETA